MVNTESGTLPTEAYWVEESTDSDGNPTTPTDPDWQLFSEVFSSAEPESEVTHSERASAGHTLAVKKAKGQESHSLTFGYDLERFPEDGSGNPRDPVWYAAKRNTVNQFAGTHSYYEVKQSGTIAANSTVHHKYFSRYSETHPSGSAPSATAKDSRTVLYGRGGRPEEAPLNFDPGDSATVTVEMSYMFDMLRKYQLDQPSSEYIHVRSTDAADTGIDVELEGIDGAWSETITTDGSDATTAVSTASTQDDLGAVHVPSSTEGTIEVYGDDGSGSGTPGAPDQLLTIVKGKDKYEGLHSDTGVHPVGSGSFDDGTSLDGKQHVISPDNGPARIQWYGPLAQAIGSSTLTFSNEIADDPTLDGVATSKDEDGQEVTLEATVWGETESERLLGARLEGKEGQITIPLDGGEIVIPRAYVAEGGHATTEAEQSRSEVEVTFNVMEPTDGSDAIQFNAA